VLGVPSESVALLATLMLRGPQTAAELRANCERIHRFSDLSATEAYLSELAAREPSPLVRQLPRQPGSREHRWMHGLCGEPARPVVECYFDCSSPWTWLGVHNLVPLAEEEGARIVWKPILVGGVFNAVNPSVYASRENPVPAKQAYLCKDLQDWARSAGLTIRFPPSVFPVNSVKAMRGCIWLESQGLLLPFARAVFEAYWTRDEDVSRDEVLRPLVERLGVDPQAFFAGIATQPVKDALRSNTEALIARGGFGSPTFFVDEDMYFGNDRLPLLREALRRAQR
jgi:2-hydroxychromene-2-carboxylate isomerase